MCRALLLGSIHCIFHATGHHYTWKKVTTTVHNIIVGKLWIDQVSKGPLSASAAQKCPPVHLCGAQDAGPGPRRPLLLSVLLKGFLSGSNHTPNCRLSVPHNTICKWPGYRIHWVTAVLGLCWVPGRLRESNKQNSHPPSFDCASDIYCRVECGVFGVPSQMGHFPSRVILSLETYDKYV